MPSTAEKEEVCRHAAEHLQRMLQLRRTPKGTQIEQLNGRPAADCDGITDEIQSGRFCSESKPGIIISSLDPDLPYTPVSITCLLPMSDEVMKLFTWHATQLLRLVRLTKCAVELNRCARLRRRMGAKSWIKFAKIVIRGANMRCIRTMDSMLWQQFSVYQQRQVVKDIPGAGSKAACCLFVSEGTPDNSALLMANQRTGGVRVRFGALHLPRRISVRRHANGGLTITPAEDELGELGDLRCQRGVHEGPSMGFARAADFLYPRCPLGRCASDKLPS